MSKDKQHILEIHEILTALKAVKEHGSLINSANIAAAAGVDPASIIGNSDFIKLLQLTAAIDGTFKFQPPSDETSQIMSFENLERFLSSSLMNRVAFPVDNNSRKPDGNGHSTPGNYKLSDQQSAVPSTVGALNADNQSTPNPNPNPNIETTDDQSITIAPDQGVNYAQISSQFASAQSPGAPAQPQVVAANNPSVATFKSPPQMPPNQNTIAQQSPPAQPQSDLELESKNKQIMLLSQKLDQVCATLAGMQNERQELHRYLADLQTFNQNLVARLTSLENQVQMKVSGGDDVIRDEISKVGQKLSDQIQTLEARVETSHASLEKRLKDAEESIRSRSQGETQSATEGESTSEELAKVKLQLVKHFQTLTAAIENVNVTLNKRLKELENQTKEAASQEDNLKKIYSDDLLVVQKQLNEHMQRLTGGLENAIAKLHGRIKTIETEGKEPASFTEQISSVKEQLVVSISESTAELEKANDALVDRVQKLEAQIAVSKSDEQKQSHDEEIPKEKAEFSAGAAESAETLESLIVQILSLQEATRDASNDQSSDEIRKMVATALKRLKKEISKVRSNISNRTKHFETTLENMNTEIGSVKNELKQKQELTSEFETIVRAEVKNEISKQSLEMKQPELEAVVRDEVKNEISKQSQEMKAELETVVRDEVKNEISKQSLEIKPEIETVVEEAVGIARKELLQGIQELTSGLETVKAELEKANNDLTKRSEELASDLETVKGEVGIAKTDLSQSAQKLTSDLEAVREEVGLVKINLSQSAGELTSGLEAVRGEVGTVRNDLSQSALELTSSFETLREEVGAVRDEAKNEISRQSQEMESKIETVVEEAVGTARKELLLGIQELTSGLETVKAELEKGNRDLTKRSEELASDLEAVRDEVGTVKNDLSQSAQTLTSGLESVKEEVGAVKNDLSQSAQTLTSSLEAVREEFGTTKNGLAQWAQELTSGYELVREDVRIVKTAFSQSVQKLITDVEGVKEAVGQVNDDLSKSAQELTSSLEGVREEVGIVKDEISLSAQALTSDLIAVRSEVGTVKNELTQSVQELGIRLEISSGEVGTTKNDLSRAAEELTSGLEAVRADLGGTKNEFSQRSAELASSLEAMKEEFQSAKNDMQLRSHDVQSNLATVQEQFVTFKDSVEMRSRELESVLERVLEDLSKVTDVGQELDAGLQSAKADLQTLRTQYTESTDSIMRSIESLIEEMATTEHGVLERTNGLAAENNQLKDQFNKLVTLHGNLNQEILSQQQSFLALKKPLEKLQQAVATISLHEDATTVRELNARVTELQVVLAALNNQNEN